MEREFMLYCVEGGVGNDAYVAGKSYPADEVGCYYYNSVGDIYQVSLIGGVQHFRLMHFELSALKKAVLMYEL